jgi:hypothetical protein
MIELEERERHMHIHFNTAHQPMVASVPDTEAE